MNCFFECAKDIKDIVVTRKRSGSLFSDLFEWLHVQIVNFDEWNIVFLIIFLICLFSQIIYYKKNKRNNRVLTCFGIIIFIITIMLSINFGNACTMNKLESTWGFSDIIHIVRYDKKIHEGDEIDGFKILKIENDGILVEYEKVTYITKIVENSIISHISNYETEKEIVTQKLLWNVTYTISKSTPPDGLESDGGTNYYYKFEK